MRTRQTYCNILENIDPLWCMPHEEVVLYEMIIVLEPVQALLCWLCNSCDLGFGWGLHGD